MFLGPAMSTITAVMGATLRLGRTAAAKASRATTAQSRRPSSRDVLAFR